jgi:hypothetical protein
MFRSTNKRAEIGFRRGEDQQPPSPSGLAYGGGIIGRRLAATRRPRQGGLQGLTSDNVTSR